MILNYYADQNGTKMTRNFKGFIAIIKEKCFNIHSVILGTSFEIVLKAEFSIKNL